MKSLVNYKGKTVKLFLISGREIMGLLSDNSSDEEVVIFDYGQEIHVRPDCVEGYVVL